MDIIILKNYFLNKSLYLLFGAGAFISTIIFLTLDMSVGFKYQICTSVIGFACLFIVYLNRLDPHYIKLNGNEFTIEYINKFAFNLGVRTYHKNDINVSVRNDILILYDRLTPFAKVRKKALERKDWDTLEKYFL